MSPSKIYAISVRITVHTPHEKTPSGWQPGFTVVNMPTFYLFADVQGIISESHAERIVRESFVRIGHAPDDINVCVVETSIGAH